MNKLATGCLMAVIMVMGACLWTGCESAGGTDGISISPGAVTLASGSTSETTDLSSTNGSTTASQTSNSYNVNGVVFTAAVKDELALPLKWSVSNPSLGYILNASGNTATYVRYMDSNAGISPVGDNVITVQDQYGNKGSAMVTQK